MTHPIPKSPEPWPCFRNDIILVKIWPFFNLHITEISHFEREKGVRCLCCACNISTNAHKFCHQCVFANDICNPWANIPNVIFCQLSFQSIVSCPKTISMTPQHLCILFLFEVTNHIKQALPAERGII